MRASVLKYFLLTIVASGLVPPAVAQTAAKAIPCSVQSVNKYADQDARLTVRCDTNGNPVIPKGTTFELQRPRAAATDPPPPPDPPPPTDPVTYYVATNGSNARSCTEAKSIATPRQTISAGLACPAAGERLYIRGGTYTDKIEDADFGANGTSAAHIIVSGYPGETVVINNGGTDGLITLATRTYIEFQDFKLDGSTFTPGPPEGDLCCNNVFLNEGTRNITFRRVEIADAWANGILSSGEGHQFIDLNVHGNGRVGTLWTPGANGIYHSGDSATFSGGVYWENLCYGVRVVDSNPAPARAEHNTIERVRAHTNGNGKAPVAGASNCGSTGGGFVVGDSDNILRNSIADNNVQGAEINGLSGKVTQNIKFYNNTFYGNTGFGFANGKNWGANLSQLINNIDYSNGAACSECQATNTNEQSTYTSNPNFTNAAIGNFTLLPGSGAIDTCTTNTAVINDFAGLARPIGGGYDCGAHEQ